MKRRKPEEDCSEDFWLEVDADDLIDADVGTEHRLRIHKNCSPRKTNKKRRLMPCWKVGLYDKEVWEVRDGGKNTPCTLIHTSTQASYEVSPSRVNKALVALDPEECATVLVPSTRNCRCSRGCTSPWTLQDLLAVREAIFRQPSEDSASRYLAAFIKTQARQEAPPDDSNESDASEQSGDNNLEELIRRRSAKCTYTISHPRTHKHVEVCGTFFARAFNISTDKLNRARSLSAAGPNAVLPTKVKLDRSRLKYNQARAFWWQLFDVLSATQQPHPPFPCQQTDADNIRRVFPAVVF